MAACPNLNRRERQMPDRVKWSESLCIHGQMKVKLSFWDDPRRQKLKGMSLFGCNARFGSWCWGSSNIWMVAWKGVEYGCQRRQMFCGMHGRSRRVRPFVPAEERFFWAIIFHSVFIHACCRSAFWIADGNGDRGRQKQQRTLNLEQHRRLFSIFRNQWKGWRILGQHCQFLHFREISKKNA